LRVHRGSCEEISELFGSGYTAAEREFEEWTDEDVIDEGGVGEEQETEAPIKEIISKQQLIDMEWKNGVINGEDLSELNRFLLKYDITTPERLRHFFAQCMKETNKGLLLREGDHLGYTQQQLENYYNSNAATKNTSGSYVFHLGCNRLH